jgi:hypothetical protein
VPTRIIDDLVPHLLEIRAKVISGYAEHALALGDDIVYQLVAALQRHGCRGVLDLPARRPTSDVHVRPLDAASRLQQLRPQRRDARDAGDLLFSSAASTRFSQSSTCPARPLLRRSIWSTSRGTSRSSC